MSTIPCRILECANSQRTPVSEVLYKTVEEIVEYNVSHVLETTRMYPLKQEEIEAMEKSAVLPVCIVPEHPEYKSYCECVMVIMEKIEQATLPGIKESYIKLLEAIKERAREDGVVLEN